MPPDPPAKLAPTALDSGLRFQPPPPPQSQTASYGPVLSSNEHKYTTDVYECTTYIYSCLLKLRCVVNCQTFNLSLFNFIDIFRPPYCINSLGPMNTSTQRMFMSVQRIDIYSCLLKLRCVINCQTFNLSLFNYIDIFRPLYCINSLGSNSAVFESLHKEKHINSTR